MENISHRSLLFFSLTRNKCCWLDIASIMWKIITNVRLRSNCYPKTFRVAVHNCVLKIRKIILSDYYIWSYFAVIWCQRTMQIEMNYSYTLLVKTSNYLLSSTVKVISALSSFHIHASLITPIYLNIWLMKISSIKMWYYDFNEYVIGVP